MNKKIIALAVAASMAAPVAMAEISVSGRMGGELVDTDTGAGNLSMGDTGMARFYIDGKMGNAFAKMGYKSGFAGDLGSPMDLREQYLGYDFGSYSVKGGRVQGVMYTLEGDVYKGTFLQMSEGRSSYNDGFINYSIQFETKVGGGKLRVNYNPTDKMVMDADGNPYTTATTRTNMGSNMGVSWKGKIGGVGVFAGYNNGTDNETAGAVSQSSMKIGASMKFGAVKGTLMLSSTDTGVATTDEDSVLVMADMGLGNGLSVNLGLGTSEAGPSAGDTTQTRLAITKQISKGVKVFGGMTTTETEGSADVTKTGAGMEISF